MISTNSRCLSSMYTMRQSWAYSSPSVNGLSNWPFGIRTTHTSYFLSCSLTQLPIWTHSFGVGFLSLIRAGAAAGPPDIMSVHKSKAVTS